MDTEYQISKKESLKKEYLYRRSLFALLKKFDSTGLVIDQNESQDQPYLDMTTIALLTRP